MSGPPDAVLLVGFGAPSRRDDVPAFVEGILRGRQAPRGRTEEVVRHYEAIGGGSPYNALTQRQAEGLRAELEKSGAPLPVYVGMRNWQPYVADVVGRMARDGVRSAFAIVLAPHRSEASWDRYVASVEAACAALPQGAPAITWNPPWHRHPRFVQAMAERVEAALASLSEARRAGAELVFCAHSIPVAMPGSERYAKELSESAHDVARALSRSRFRIAYQSRSGPKTEAWLGPQVEEALGELSREAGRACVAVPIGFLCDHVEVLYDLDVEAAAEARRLGIPFARAGTVGDHPSFLALLALLVAEARGAAAGAAAPPPPHPEGRRVAG